jgi:hypothetical protein
MLSMNAQGNSDNPLLKKWTGPYGGVLLSMNTISHKLNQL